MEYERELESRQDGEGYDAAASGRAPGNQLAPLPKDGVWGDYRFC